MYILMSNWNSERIRKKGNWEHVYLLCVCRVCVNENSVLRTVRMRCLLKFQVLLELLRWLKKKNRIKNPGNHAAILSSLNKFCCHISPVIDTFQIQQSMEYKFKSDGWNVFR